MSESLTLARRKLSPQKLKAARMRAQYGNVTQFAQKVGIHRTAYLKWEDPSQLPKTHIDYVAFSNVLALLGVSYEEITDPMQDGAA